MAKLIRASKDGVGSRLRSPDSESRAGLTLSVRRDRRPERVSAGRVPSSRELSGPQLFLHMESVASRPSGRLSHLPCTDGLQKAFRRFLDKVITKGPIVLSVIQPPVGPQGPASIWFWIWKSAS